MTAGSQRELIVVAGPGRSGTSLTTGLLSELGYLIPGPEIEADVTNPRGFGETQWVLEFHRELMRSAGVVHGDARPAAFQEAAEISRRADLRSRLSGWLDEFFEQSNLVVVKDPRLLWFVDLWTHAAGAVGARTTVLTVLRDPVAVTKSSMTHYSNLPAATRVASWINSVLITERGTRGLRRTSVRYDGILSDWQGVLEEALALVQLPRVSTATDAQRTAGDGLIDLSLLRSGSSSWADLSVPDWLQSLASRIYELLVDASPVPSSTDDFAAAMDAFAAEYQQLHRWSEEIVFYATSRAQRRARAQGRRTGRAEERAALAVAHAVDPVDDPPGRPAPAGDTSGPVGGLTRVLRSIGRPGRRRQSGKPART